MENNVDETFDTFDCFGESDESKQRGISDELQTIIAPIVIKHLDNLDYTLISLTEAFKTVEDADELNFQVRCATANIEQSFRDCVGEATTAIQENGGTTAIRQENGGAFIDFEEQVKQLKLNNDKFLKAIKHLGGNLGQLKEAKPNPEEEEEDTQENEEDMQEDMQENPEYVSQLAAEDTVRDVELEAELEAKQEEIERLIAELAHERSLKSADAQHAHEQLKTQAELMELQAAQLEEYEKNFRAYKDKYRAMVEDLATAKGNVRIICRIKPEDAAQEELIGLTNPKGDHPFIPWSTLRMTYPNDSGRVESRDFEFQRTFGTGENNEEIFNEVKEFAQSALAGNSCTIMAYGATGTGKTYTFLSEDGLVNRYVSSAFEIADEDHGQYEYRFYLSAVEIYLNKVLDLLQHNERGQGQKVEVRIGDETNVRLNSQQEAAQLIKRTVDRREVAATRQNNTSSRSHFVLSLIIERHIAGDENNGKTKGSIFFADLAGMERIGRNMPSGTPSAQETLIFNQGKDINEALLDLGKSIRSIATSGKFFPGHNLTRFLRSSLTQGSRLLVVATVSPLFDNRNNTSGTLRWCQEAVGSTPGTTTTRAGSDKRTPTNVRPPAQTLPRTPSRQTIASPEPPTPTRGPLIPSRGRRLA
ncbi:hypothetical protein GQX73_g10301 [Xylaria multiplex]|uniref:Kinesin motor domain-containing protein n=1 Tax=Xylaria multiplex TaxID=323545 RepID=A0A7C8MXI0_9PEZI|nr:hypothetical protein GQX73_g10301 [Xylaria multiplex]